MWRKKNTTMAQGSFSLRAPPGSPDRSLGSRNSNNSNHDVPLLGRGASFEDEEDLERMHGENDEYVRFVRELRGLNHHRHLPDPPTTTSSPAVSSSSSRPGSLVFVRGPSVATGIPVVPPVAGVGGSKPVSGDETTVGTDSASGLALDSWDEDEENLPGWMAIATKPNPFLRHPPRDPGIDIPTYDTTETSYFERRRKKVWRRRLLVAVAVLLCLVTLGLSSAKKHLARDDTEPKARPLASTTDIEYTKSTSTTGHKKHGIKLGAQPYHGLHGNVGLQTDEPKAVAEPTAPPTGSPTVVTTTTITNGSSDENGGASGVVPAVVDASTVLESGVLLPTNQGDWDEEGCVDDETFVIAGNPRMTCAWVREAYTARRCGFSYGRTSALFGCPGTCAPRCQDRNPWDPLPPPARCADDDTAAVAGDPRLTCAWVRQKPDHRCGVGMWSDRGARMVCPGTCHPACQSR